MGTLLASKRKNTIIGKFAKKFSKVIGANDRSKGKLVESESNDPNRFKEVVTTK